MINKLRAILAIGLLLALGALSAPAMALGLGQIKVLSQPGQPLLAEIPVVTSDPSELDNLQARLASPDTFRRIGLQPPQGIVSNLQFRLALDARGNPVIRVTSDAPVQQPLLTFLVEVDWGQGRLVREYSALLDAPRTVAAPVQAPIQAPVAPPSNAIVRPPAPPPVPVASEAPEAVAESAPADPTPSTPTAPPPAAAAPPSQNAIAVAPPPVAAPPASPPPVPASRPAEYGPVRAGDTLGAIAARLRPPGSTLDQAMVALLRANPGAFIDDNINLVRQGAVLRMPDGDALARTSAAEASAIVREQVSQWRDMRQPAAPPPTAAAAPTQSAASNTQTGTTGARRASEARLEITPPSDGSGQSAGTRSGIAAGGEGDMLRQQMQQTQETLAARNAEVEELKARVAELEQLQQQQQQLISLKDSELAAAQARLADSNAAAGAEATETAATVQPAPPPADPGEGGGFTWLALGLALVLAGVAAWWLMRRKPAPGRGRSFDTSALAAGMSRPEALPAEAVADDLLDDADDDRSVPVAAADRGLATPDLDEPEPPPSAWNPPPPGSVEMAAPTWHSGTRPADVDAAAGSPVPEHASGTPGSAPGGRERIELASAYIDLGDTETARSLLQEVVDGSDPDASEEARRLLRGMA
ncbi:FimV/HubP family polar landmark protein [Luteimonas vadosa]|uniref:FimV N-terminal domain-containing protein n=1 Tax=Luteimonas vadosa TaxID=1165507 RepID=A0ABP9DZW6_9GAMM